MLFFCIFSVYHHQFPYFFVTKQIWLAIRWLLICLSLTYVICLVYAASGFILDRTEMFTQVITEYQKHVKRPKYFQDAASGISVVSCMSLSQPQNLLELLEI